jgi:vancomycin permeability regulator SanA
MLKIIETLPTDKALGTACQPFELERGIWACKTTDVQSGCVHLHDFNEKQYCVHPTKKKPAILKKW